MNGRSLGDGRLGGPGGVTSCLARGALALAVVLAAATATLAQPVPIETDPIVLDLSDRVGNLVIERKEDGNHVFRVTLDGREVEITPEQFAAIVHREKRVQRERGLLFVVFNITSWWGVLWVAIGFGGQAMFTFRMVLQWLVSEKARRSVVPVGFWWGSLIGGGMLLAYFIWRKDIVGVVGQSTGAFIYARNLWLIYFGSPPGAADDKPPPAVPPDTANMHG